MRPTCIASGSAASGRTARTRRPRTRGLAEMYVADERFKAYYEAWRPRRRRVPPRRHQGFLRQLRPIRCLCLQAGHPTLLSMSRFATSMKSALRAPARRLVAWVRAPFASLYRVAAAVLAAGAVCLALPPWVGLLLFAPVAAVVGVKVAHAVRAVTSLCYVGVAENREGHPSLDVRRDLLQRSRALGAASVAAGVAVLLAVRAALAVFPGLAGDGGASLPTWRSRRCCWVASCRSTPWRCGSTPRCCAASPASPSRCRCSSSWWRWPGILLSWAMDVLAGLGVPAEGLLQGGFAWLYEMQRLLGAAVGGRFLKQDTLIVGVSIVAAALLLLLYTYSVPLYWLRSVSRWLKGIGVAVAAFGAAVIVFAGVWLADVQHLAEQGAAGHLGAGLDAGLASSQAQAIAQYRSDDLVALIKAFVLPYTVGVFVANGVVAWRKGRAKQTADGILDWLCRRGTCGRGGAFRAAQALPLLLRRQSHALGYRPALHRPRCAPSAPLRPAQAHAQGAPDRRVGGPAAREGARAATRAAARPAGRAASRPAAFVRFFRPARRSRHARRLQGRSCRGPHQEERTKAGSR